MKKYCLVVIGLVLASVSFFPLAADDKQSIELVLNSFHQAAANAQAEPYFDLLNEDAIFLGTDASERWTKAEFKTFVTPYFDKGQGWLYTPTERNVTLVTGTKVAFFDELLFSKSYGTCRGSGVLLKTDNGWKISQYNLSIPMPNAIAKELVATIASHQGK